MHLKSLTLKGFKSFAQPTTFQFETGVTCVVGPNGSGKSNVVDALAWVMGEQGAKTLRGGKMEDVIFAGTSTRGPLGRAEVTLTIDNADGALPIDYTEVAIRRTLFRNGGSEYAINGTSCRLLDVQELLSDSGLGREMHVIVGQGRLDNVLRATPEERRGFIEEAAGILKHRRRKERTLRKLEGMQANLTRLNDLAGEIRRQLKPLGRQAEVARQAQTVAAVVRDARARLVADEVVTLRRALAEHTRTEEERTTERMVLQEKLDRAVLRSERIVEEQEGDEVDGARRTAFALEQVQERLRNLLSLAQQRLALLGSADDAPEAASATTPAQVQESRHEAERLTGLIGEAEAGWASARQATAAARQALDALDEEIQAQSALVSRHDLEIAGLTGRAETAGSRLAAVRGEVLRQQNALDAARARLAAAEAERERGEAEGEADEQGGSELTRAYEDAQADVATEESAIEAVREELHAKERERDALAAREQALASALDQRDGSSDLVAAGLPGVRGLLAEHVHVHPGFEQAVAAALGTLADAVLAETHDDAVAALRRAVDDDLGRVEVVVAGSGGTPVEAPGTDGPVLASAVVDAPDGVRRILAGVVIVDDLAQAVALLDGPDAPATAITRAGEVVSAHVLRGGSGASGAASASVDPAETAEPTSPEPSPTPTAPSPSPAPTLADLTAWTYTMPGFSWPAAGTVTANDIGVLAASGSTTAILASGDVRSTGTARVGATGTVGDTRVLVTDAQVSALVDRALSAETDEAFGIALAQLSATLAADAREADGHVVVAGLERGWAASDGRLGELLDAIQALPYSDTAPLTSALGSASVPLQVVDHPEDADRVNRVAGSLSLEAQVAAFSKAVERPELITGQQRLLLLATLSNRWRDDADGAVTVQDGYIAQADAILSSVAITTRQNTVISDTSSLLINVSNALDQPVTVRMTIIAGSGRIRVDDSVVVTVPAHGSASARPPITSISNGDLVVTARLTTEDGSVQIGDSAPVELLIRAGFEAVVTTLFVVAVALLFGFGLFRSIRKRRRARARQLAGLPEETDD
ncbi:Chromosome partition protein Smc [Clavibacter michiganensis]|nr:Chromosome partition protein Smc [Clavibacter michiganensis]